MLAVGVSWLILDAIKSRKSVGIFFIVIAIIMGIIVNQAFGENPLTRTGVLDLDICCLGDVSLHR